MHKTIVWLEDDINIIEPVIKPLLQTYRVERITTVKEAMERIDLLRDADLILLDVLLPTGTAEESSERYTGVKLLEDLRAQGIKTPVLVFSVVGMKEVDSRLQQLGIEGYVRKPVFPSELQARVEEIFGASAAPGP